MHIRKHHKILILLLLFLGCIPVSAQHKRTEASVDFRVNSTVIDSSYSNNRANVEKLTRWLDSLAKDHSTDLLDVTFNGTASPEGSSHSNHKLSQERIKSLENLVRSKYNLPDSIITRNDTYIPWDNIKAEVIKSDLPYKEQILQILSQEEKLVVYKPNGDRIDNSVLKLRELASGAVWEQMDTMFFTKLRNATVVFLTYKHKEQALSDTIAISQDTLSVPLTAVPMQDTSKVEVSQFHEEVQFLDQWRRQTHISTNLLGLGLAIANASVEFDLCRHLSLSVPVHYSAWDYFKTTIKFRTLSAYPELRVWFNENNDKLFLGAHFGVAYYNYAIDGDYRYQDHDRQTPAMGGGLSLGFRFPLSRSGRWKMEFSVGGGVYTNHYDVFHNTPVTQDGLMISTHKGTYIGPDRANASLCYTIGLDKKGGKR